jgi:O-antigen ligase
MHFFSPQPRTTSPLHLGLGFTLFILLTWSAFDYGGRYLHVQAFAQALTGGLLLLSLSRPLLTPVPPFFKTWGCWGLVLTLSFAFSGNRLASLEEILRWLMYAGIFWSAYTYSQSPRQRSWLTTAILLIGTAICSLGWLTAEAGLVVSSFHRTNDLAGYLLLLLPFGLQVTLTSQGWLRTLGTLSSLLFLASLIATNSRSSWASAAVSLGVLVWLNRKVLTPSLWRWMLSLLAIGSSLGLLLFAPKVFPRLMTLFSITQENATAWRGALLESAWKIFIQYPFTGSGPNTFGSAIRSVQTTPGYYSIDPHNFYLLLLSEVGIFGLFGFLWLIYQILSGISHQEQPLKAGILASLMGCQRYPHFIFHFGRYRFKPPVLCHTRIVPPTDPSLETGQTGNGPDLINSPCSQLIFLTGLSRCSYLGRKQRLSGSPNPVTTSHAPSPMAISPPLPHIGRNRVCPETSTGLPQCSS